MQYFKLRNGFFGAAVGVALAALTYLGEQFLAFSFLPLALFDWLARVMPGEVVTLGIDTVVDLVLLTGIGGSTDTAAKTIEQLLAVTLFVAAWAIFGWVIGVLHVLSQRPSPWIGTIVGALLGIGAALVAVDWGGATLLIVVTALLVALHMAAGWVVGWAQSAVPAQEESARERRQFLLQFAAVSGLTSSAWAVGRFLTRRQAETAAAQTLDLSANEVQLAYVATEPARLQERLRPAPGTRQELTPTGEFYRIDINARPPTIDRAEWQLQVDGLFDSPRNLTLAELMAFPAVRQPLTLSCISNRIGGDLISAAEWTGVRLGLLLEELGLQEGAQELFIEAEDGFYESVSMQDMMDPRTLMVYAMNGQSLPQEHGFPLRLYIPNRYGMKQPKWITRIEAIAGEGAGYRVDRGWSEEARPHIVSIIDSVAVDQRTEDGRVPIGGIAWAGDRGINAVELQVDDGAWQPARLRNPPLSTLTWVQWPLDWPASPGSHAFRVRATDGERAVQIEETTDVRPDGATGLHTVTRTVS